MCACPQIWMIDGQPRQLDKIAGRRKKKRSYEYEVTWVGLTSLSFNRWITREVSRLAVVLWAELSLEAYSLLYCHTLPRCAIASTYSVHARARAQHALAALCFCAWQRVMSVCLMRLVHESMPMQWSDGALVIISSTPIQLSLHLARDLRIEMGMEMKMKMQSVARACI